MRLELQDSEGRVLLPQLLEDIDYKRFTSEPSHYPVRIQWNTGGM